MTTVLGQANSAWPGVPRWAGSLVLGLVLGAAGSVPAVAQEAPLGRDLPGLLAYARAQSPEIRAMREEAEAAAQRVGPAGALRGAHEHQQLRQRRFAQPAAVEGR